MRATPERIALAATVWLVGVGGAVAQLAVPPLDILLVVGSVLVVLLTVPLGVIAAVFDRRYDPERAVRLTTVAVAGLAFAAGVAIAVGVDPGAAPLAAAAFVALGAFWIVLPTSLGLWVARRWSVRVRWVAAAWPVSTLLAGAVFYATVVFGLSNLRAVAGPVGVAAAVVGVVALAVAGPALLGPGLSRVRRRLG